MANVVLYYGALSTDKEIYNLKSAARCLSSALEVLDKHGVHLPDAKDIVNESKVTEAISRLVAGFPPDLGREYSGRILDDYRASMKRFSRHISLDYFDFSTAKIRLAEGVEERVKSKHTVFATDGQAALLERLQSVADEINDINATLRDCGAWAYSVLEGAPQNLIDVREGRAVVKAENLQYFDIPLAVAKGNTNKKAADSLPLFLEP